MILRGAEPEPDDVAAAVRFQWGLALLCNHNVHDLSLPVPNIVRAESYLSGQLSK